MLRLSDITIYSDGSVIVNQQMPLIYNRLAIVSKIESLFLDPRAMEVNAIAYQDANIPVSPLKGHTIPVLPAMQNYVKKIQSRSAASWVLAPWMLWINRAYNGDGTDATEKDLLPMAECIGAGYGNFIEIIGEVTSRAGKFYELRCFEYDDPMRYDPLLTWQNRPTLFGKCTARRRKDGVIMNVGDGLDCYFPNMKRTAHLWISANDVELFPPLPAGIRNYALDGASVYGWDGLQYHPLRLARKPGELIHPTAWRLQTGSVIPPVT